MAPFEYITREGAIEVAGLLGVSADEMMQCQDWEYTFPELSDLPRYLQIYDYNGLSDLAKRVLGCFIFECLEEHLRGRGSDSLVRSSLELLAGDYKIHQHEFQYWSLRNDEHYDQCPEDGWAIMVAVREQMSRVEEERD